MRLCSLLQLGNVTFVEGSGASSGGGDDDVAADGAEDVVSLARCDDASPFARAAAALGLDPAALRHALCNRTIHTPGAGSTVIPLTERQACAARDAIAKVTSRSWC